MTKLELYGTVKEGRLTISNRKRFEADLATFPDCDVQVIVKKRGKRSNSQNRYYWGVVIDEIRREFLRRGERFEPEQIHEALKLKFNPVKTVDTGSGEVLLDVPGTTTEMNKEEFGQYLDRVIEWCNKSLEIIIPEPGEQTQLFAA